jgi:trans-aconitate methyltransferase
LGCGQGLSTNIFASCHPDGQFHGIDFNRTHIQGARELSRQARLANTTFWEASFDDLGKLALPEFDFITLNGVYSWVNADNRKHIVDFIRCKLKVGGVVYVSYNSLPGWSPVAPIRQLLISCAGKESGTLEEQINASIEFVERLKSMNLSYFNTNPSAAGFFELISNFSRNYLAHEYFNENWVLFYHSDVVKDFVSAQMTFVGSATFVDNFDFLRFSPEEQQLLNGIADPVLKETVKDFAVNQRFRRDVFTNVRKQLSQTDHLERVSRCRFTLVVPWDQTSITPSFPRGEALLDPELVKPILHALEEQQHSLDEFLRKPGIARFGSEKTLKTLMSLISAGYLLPAVKPSPHAIASTRLFNFALLERTIRNMEPQYLASPVVQSGIQLDWIQRLLLLCELTDNEDPFSFVAGMMRENNFALIKDGAASRSWDENIAELDRTIRAFRAVQLPLLKRLGVL